MGRDSLPAGQWRGREPRWPRFESPARAPHIAERRRAAHCRLTAPAARVNRRRNSSGVDAVRANTILQCYDRLATAPDCPYIAAMSPNYAPTELLDPSDDGVSKALPSQVSDGWLRQYAQMFATGMSQQAIAERIGKPVATLARASQLPAFQSLVKEYCRESTSSTSADRLLAGSAIDTLLVVMSIRDNPAVSPRDRLAACSMLLPHALGLPGKTPKAPQKSTIEALLSNAGADESLEKLLDRDILSKLEKHPELATRLSGERRPGQGSTPAVAVARVPSRG